MEGGRLALALMLAAALGACSAEDQCREGVGEISREFRALHSADDGRLSRDDDLVEGGMHVNNAESQLATRNFEGCVESLRQARDYLARARDKLEAD